MNFEEILRQMQFDVFHRFSRDQIDSNLFDFLQRVRTNVEENRSIETSKALLQILLEYSWEKLNTGIWQNVSDIYRYFYAYSCYLDVFIDCRSSQNKMTKQIYSNFIKRCDLGILLGGPILEKEFNQLISLINEHLRPKNDDGEEKQTKRIRVEETEFQWMPIPIIDPRKAIERRQCPSIEEFFTHFIQLKKPVILTGCIDHWPALKKWSFDYLIQIAGDRTVPIELGSRYSDDDWTQKLMTIKEFVQQYCQQRTVKCGYLAQHPLLDQIPDLKKDICIPDYCYLTSNENDEEEDVDLNTWIGPKQTISPLHNDPKQNLLAQVVGEKYIRLYDPIHSSRLYALDSSMLNNTSSIDVENPNFERFPLFRDVPYTETILRPGDMLYLPARHWHYVRSLSPSFSVNFWWT